MKITIETLPAGAEEEIVIRTDDLDEDMLQLIYALKARRSRLAGYAHDGIVRLDPAQVYYFEAVDNKVCACCEHEVYDVHRKLYELEELLAYSDFVRISKAMIVNVAKIQKVIPLFNSRLEAVLLNGEKVVISRQYVPALKQKLGL